MTVDSWWDEQSALMVDILCFPNLTPWPFVKVINLITSDAMTAFCVSAQFPVCFRNKSARQHSPPTGSASIIMKRMSYMKHLSTPFERGTQRKSMPFTSVLGCIHRAVCGRDLQNSGAKTVLESMCSYINDFFKRRILATVLHDENKFGVDFAAI